MKKYLIILLVLLSSCSKDDVTEELLIQSLKEDSIEDLDNKTNYTLWESNLSDINKTSGTIADNLFVPNELVPIKVLNELFREVNQEENYVGYVKANSYRYLDFNTDGRIDLFAFQNRVLLNKSAGNEFIEGRFILVSDVHGKQEISSVSAGRSFSGVFEPNDFDGDGELEFIIFGSDDHVDHYGVRVGYRKPLTLVDFTSDGQIITKEIGNKTSSHDLTSGDIDNDGDVDIVVSEWYLEKGYDGGDFIEKVSFLFYINDGSGNFTTTKENLVFEEQFERDSKDFFRTAVDAFDLNNDGYLDLVLGDYSDDGLRYNCEDYDSNPCPDYSFPMNGHYQVVWGTEDGKYIYKNSTLLLYETNIEDGRTPFGFSFVDMNQDGLFDIIAYGVEGNMKYQYIDIYMNLGDNKFSDVIESNFYERFNESNPNSHFLSFLYTLNTEDRDGDGLWDLVPRVQFFGDWYDYFLYSGRNIMGEDTYFRNNGQTFDVIEDFIE